MPEIYTVKIVNTGEIFSPSEQKGPLWEKALEASRGITHAVCLCRKGDDPRTVAIKLSPNKKYYLARYGATHHHRKDCRFYGLNPTQSGRQGYTEQAVLEQADGSLAIKLARSLSPPRGAVEANLKGVQQSRSTQGVRRSAMGLGGLLDLLWEEAKLNQWNSGTSKRWDLKTGTALLRQAERIHVGSHTLDKALLLPAFKETHEATRNLKIVEKARQSGLRLIVIGPLAKFDESRDSWADANVETAQPLQMLLDTYYGIPKMMLTAASRTAVQSSYRNEIAAWQRNEKVYAIAQFVLRDKKTKNPKEANVADVLEVCLLHLSERFIPLDSSYEEVIEKLLTEEKRSFIKPLRYEADDEVFPDFWLLDMGCDYPMEVFGMDTEDYQMRKDQKFKIYSDIKKYPSGWWYWDALTKGKIPELPSPPVVEPKEP